MGSPTRQLYPVVNWGLTSPAPSEKVKTKKTPADGRAMKIIPRRPSKREACRARKLSMTDFEQANDGLNPHPKRLQRRSTCFEPPGGASVPARGVVIRMRAHSVCPVGEKDPFLEMVEAMVAKGVKLLALDFDQTIIACHTRSQWYVSHSLSHSMRQHRSQHHTAPMAKHAVCHHSIKQHLRTPLYVRYGTAEELARHVRPAVRRLIVAAVKTGMRIAIVSFSGQCAMIRGALACAMPGIDTSLFAVACSDKQWEVSEMQLRRLFPHLPMPPAGLRVDTLCKLPHLCFALQQLAEKDCTLNIQPHNIVLLDDDEMNVASAHAQGVTAVHLVLADPEAFLSVLGDLYLFHAESHHNQENHPPPLQQQHQLHHPPAIMPLMQHSIVTTPAGAPPMKRMLTTPMMMPHLPVPAVMMVAPSLSAIATSVLPAPLMMPPPMHVPISVTGVSLSVIASNVAPPMPMMMMGAPSLSAIARNLSPGSRPLILMPEGFESDSRDERRTMQNCRPMPSP
jgi:hypothetical protein